MSPAVDIFACTERLYVDSKSRCQIARREPGGGINVARNLRRMGLDVMALFPAGGFGGELLTQLLKRDLLPFKRIPISNETTQNMGLVEKESGRQFHLVFPGAKLQESEWQQCLSSISALEPAPEYLVVSGSLPPGVPVDFFARVAALAKERGIKLVLDISGKPLQLALESGVYLVKLNREDFSSLGYSGGDNYQSRLSALTAMVAKGYADIMVLTLGPRGALLATREGDHLHAAPPPVEVVSHVGAGDSFVSVMFARLIRGNSVPEAFRYGVAAAAAKISTAGNQL
jgi:6-phosphofructokinase 2